MEAIVEASISEKWNAKIAAVISNEPEAAGLKYAQSKGIPTAVVSHKNYPSRQAFDEALMQVIDGYGPDLVVLAGFMRILTPTFVQHYQDGLMNIHPSLLPAFPGLRTHESAIEAGVHEHGATVHFVTEALDHGPVVIQASVPVMPGDSAAQLAARVLKQEHIIYPRAVRWFIEDRLVVVGNQVKVTPPESQFIMSGSN